MTNDTVRLLQVLRAFRLMRIARVVRMLPAFREMWLLVRGLADSMNTLLWSLVLVLFVLYVFGIFALEFIGRAKLDDGQSAWWDITNSDDVAIAKLLSSLPQTMFTLVQFMTLDSWTSIARPIEEKYPGSIYFFLFFVMIATFVLLNLVTAVIVNNALDISKKDEEQTARLKELENLQELKDLSDLFQFLDVDGSGSVSMMEFSLAFENPAIKNKLQILEIEPPELEDLFKLLDDEDGEGELDLAEFALGMCKIKGEAKSKDMLEALRKVDRMELKVDAAISRLGATYVPKSRRSSEGGEEVETAKKNDEKDNNNANNPAITLYEEKQNQSSERDISATGRSTVQSVQAEDISNRVLDNLDKDLREMEKRIQDLLCIDEEAKQARNLEKTPLQTHEKDDSTGQQLAIAVENLPRPKSIGEDLISIINQLDLWTLTCDARVDDLAALLIEMSQDLKKRRVSDEARNLNEISGGQQAMFPGMGFPFPPCAQGLYHQEMSAAAMQGLIGGPPPGFFPYGAPSETYGIPPWQLNTAPPTTYSNEQAERGSAPSSMGSTSAPVLSAAMWPTSALAPQTTVNPPQALESQRSIAPGILTQGWPSAPPVLPFGTQSMISVQEPSTTAGLPPTSDIRPTSTLAPSTIVEPPQAPPQEKMTSSAKSGVQIGQGIEEIRETQPIASVPKETMPKKVSPRTTESSEAIKALANLKENEYLF